VIAAFRQQLDDARSMPGTPEMRIAWSPYDMAIGQVVALGGEPRDARGAPGLPPRCAARRRGVGGGGGVGRGAAGSAARGRAEDCRVSQRSAPVRIYAIAAAIVVAVCGAAFLRARNQDAQVRQLAEARTMAADVGRPHEGLLFAAVVS